MSKVLVPETGALNDFWFRSYSKNDRLSKEKYRLSLWYPSIILTNRPSNTVIKILEPAKYGP